MSLSLIALIAAGLIILFAIVVSVYGIIRAINNESDISQRIESYAVVQDLETRFQDQRRSRPQFHRLRLQLNSLLSAFTSEELSLQLISANWPITETEFIIIRGMMMIIGFFLGWLIFNSWLPGIGISILTFYIPAIYLRRSISQRRLKFGRQLVDILVLIAGGIRAGFSFLQALDLVIEEMGAPACDEFRRVRREVGLGIPLGEALGNLSKRMQNDDLDLVVTSIQINSQVGGNLSVMLDAITETIRERIRLFSEIRSVTSQQRNTGYLLTVLPFLVGGLLFIINPTYMARLFEPTIFLCIPIGAFLFIIIGNVLIRVIVKIDV